MTRTPEEWQDELRRRIPSSYPALKEAGITSLYAIVAATVLYPVVTGGSDWLPALAALVGDIGASLIDNLIRGARDEVDLARRVETLPDGDQTQDVICDLLDKLDAVRIVRENLLESEWERLEMFLDRKLAPYSTGTRTFPLECDAPILTAQVDKNGARQSAYLALKRAWWCQDPVAKSTLELAHWPIAFFDAACLVKYEDRIEEEVSDSEGGSTTITRYQAGTANTTVQVVAFPITSVIPSEHRLPMRVYDVLNGLELARELDWGGNVLASWSYDHLCASLFGAPPAHKVNQIRYWENRAIDFASTPGRLYIAEQDIAKEARRVAKRCVVQQYTWRTRSVLDVEPGPESLKIAQYPFWLFQADSKSGVCQVVVDGMAGHVLFIQGAAGRRAHLLASLAAILVIALVLALALALVALVLGIFLWLVGALLTVVHL